MVNELTVVEGRAPEPPTADATYTVAPGQAMRGPATLTAGRHTVKFEAGPGSEELEPTVAKLSAGTTFSEMDAYLTRLFEGEEPPPKGAAARAPGQVAFGGFDLMTTRAFYVTIDFEPGNYVIVAEDVDKEDRPKPPKEMITVKVT